MTNTQPETIAARPEILVVRGLTRAFGGLLAVNEVSFSIYPGEIYGLIGPNGAGKTTVINMLSGLLPPTSGRIEFKGRSIERLPAYRITELGVARTYQNIRLFGEMTVLQNVIVGQHCRLRAGLAERLVFAPTVRREEAAAKRKAQALLTNAGLESMQDYPASSLPYGSRRRLEIARALASDPELLLLDEPAAGMNSAEREELQERLRALVASGLTILLIEHDVSLVMSLCNRIGVLNFGNMIAQGTPAEIGTNPAVIEAYLGTDDRRPATDDQPPVQDES
jgi:branched-chain amino acid transport system ATP-binding protein